MRYIETIHAQGHVLCHDITVIVKDVKKGVAFKKGHVDVCMGQNMRPTTPQEGKIELIATCDGLLTIDSARLEAVNAIEEIMIATRHGFTPVKAGDKLAGTRVIPLVIKKEKMERVKRVAGETPLLQVLPFRPLRCGIVTTGNEVFYGRIQDTFTPVIEQKLKDYGMTVMGHTLCPDDPQKITAAILELRDQGAELIMTTGGMSVDPDDRTPAAIRATGARMVTYGAPVLPGAMMLVAYLPTESGEIPVLGLPGCVMYAKRTVFDLVLPRVSAGVEIKREDLVRMGEGGLCLNCPVCTWPNCGFGK